VVAHNADVAAPRRMGAENSKTRLHLLDVTERLMIEKGYAEVGVRKVARAAEVAPALVLYYFKTLDDLFLAALRRRADQELERQARLLREATHPVRAMWSNTPSAGSVLLNEFVALANHREAIAQEMATYSERLRQLQLQALREHQADYPYDPAVLPPETVPVLLTWIAQAQALERQLGFTTGHAETVALVERLLRPFLGDPSDTSPGTTPGS
jgi:AcrR family transcriptional regulator